MNSNTRISTYIAFDTIHQAMKGYIERASGQQLPDPSTACWLSMMDELSEHVEDWEHNTHKHISRLEEKVQNLEADVKEYEKKESVARSLMAIKEDEIAKLREENFLLLSKYKNLQDKIESLEKDLEQTHIASKDNLRSSLEMKEYVTIIEDEVARLRKELEDLKKVPTV
jgi:chromosome segregation ATPase